MREPAFLTCIYCHHEFEHKEVFIAFMDEEDKVVIAECLKCSEQYLANTKKEKLNTGWAVLQRDYDNYEIKS